MEELPQRGKDYEIQGSSIGRHCTKIIDLCVVFAVAAFGAFVAAAVAAVFVAVDMFALVLCHVFPPVIPLCR